MRWRRSPAEIAFRLAQESWNLKSYFFPPHSSRIPDRITPIFPAPEAVLGFLSAAPHYRRELVTLARQIVAGQVPLLGTSVEFKPEENDPSDWRRDLVSGVGSGLSYFRRIPYLDPRRVGDHKVIWELNRHQHLVVLAQAALLEPDSAEWIPAITRNLDSWFEANPWHRGINWASALEVAFRAMSWIWILHLIGDRLPAETRTQLVQGLYRHAEHLAHNLSIYFAPNTHLIGEALCLYLAGRTLSVLPEAAGWLKTGAHWVERCLDTQVRPDGSHFEQSSYYHLYSVDFFLTYATIAPVTQDFRDRLRCMCTLLSVLTDRDGSFPLLGDDDGGRFFYPFGRRRFFPRATLTAASFFFDEPSWRFGQEDYAEFGLWLLGPVSSEEFDMGGGRRNRIGSFRDSGLAVGGDSEVRIVFCAKAFGPGAAGHSHAHALHFCLRFQCNDLLLDSGTLTYVGDDNVRNRYRATAAHNTLRVDSRNQATPENPFRWASDRWEGNLSILENVEGKLHIEACVSEPAGGLRVTRSLRWSTDEALVIEDEVAGVAGEHLIEQFWHVPASTRWDAESHRLVWLCGATLSPDENADADYMMAEISEALYHKAVAATLRIARRSSLPARFCTVIRFASPAEGPDQTDAIKLAGPP